MDEQRDDDLTGARDVDQQETVTDQLAPGQEGEPDAAYGADGSEMTVDPDMGISDEVDEKGRLVPDAQRPVGTDEPRDEASGGDAGGAEAWPSGQEAPSDRDE